METSGTIKHKLTTDEAMLYGFMIGKTEGGKSSLQLSVKDSVFGFDELTMIAAATKLRRTGLINCVFHEGSLIAQVAPFPKGAV